MLFSVLDSLSTAFGHYPPALGGDLEYTAMTLVYSELFLIMHHVVSATTNPAKIQAILQAF